MVKDAYSQIAEAIEYLCRKAKEQPPLTAVAEEVGLSSFHFQRVFQNWAGVSPKRFLQFLTLGTARHLLWEGATLEGASHAVGLSGTGRLHDLFLHLEGMTPGQFKRRGQGVVIHWAVLPTPLGHALFAVLNRRLVALSFLDSSGLVGAREELERRWPEGIFQESPALLEPFGAELANRLRGIRDQSLALTLRGTPFQLKVWEALLRIPEAKVLTYQGLARAVGPQVTARAVGAAIRRNPIACLIPCHRVIRDSGAYGFFYWGTERKEALLALEQARVTGTSREGEP